MLSLAGIRRRNVEMRNYHKYPRRPVVMTDAGAASLR